MKRNIISISVLFCLLASAVFAAADRASAQNNSLFSAQPVAVNNSLVAAQQQPQQQSQQQPQQQQGMTLADASWTYQTPTDRKPIQVNDIVKVSVSVKSQMTSTGTIDRKKTGYSDWKLTDWIKIYQGGSLGTVGGSNGQSPYGAPEIRGDLDSQMQAHGNLQTADKLSFVISCHIVDKRPNGNLVLEGNWSVSDNDDKWEYSLSGECRAEDIKDGNTIVSDTIADLRIIKREAGDVRDSYRRGWALQWLDKWQPF